VGAIQGEHSIGTFVWRLDFVTTDIPPLDNTTRHRYEVLRACGREANTLHWSLMFYDA
jgi:hypothetical protein